MRDSKTQKMNIEIPVPIIHDNAEFNDLWQSIVDREKDGNSDIIFLYFGATWCGPCHIWKPQIMKFMKQLIKDKKAKCFQLDIDKCPDGAGWCNVNSIPALVKFKGKKRLNTWTGNLLHTIIQNE